MFKILLLLYVSIIWAQGEAQITDEDQIQAEEIPEIQSQQDDSKAKIEKQEPTDDGRRVIQDFMIRDKKIQDERDTLKQTYELEYADWFDTDEYSRGRTEIAEAYQWKPKDTNYIFDHAQQVSTMSGAKYSQYIIAPNGQFVGFNQTWILLIGAQVDPISQSVAREMHIVAKKFRKAKKTTYRWEFIDQYFDPELTSTLTKRKHPMLYVIDSEDGLVHAWDKAELPNNKTLAIWLKDREFKNSVLSFNAPILLTNPYDLYIADVMKFLRLHIVYGFEKIFKYKPDGVKLIFSAFMDHDGTDPLRMKGEKLIPVVFIAGFLFVVLPALYIVYRILAIIFAYNVVVEVDEKEYERLKKLGKID